MTRFYKGDAMIRQLVLGVAAATMVGCNSNGAFDVGSKEEAAKYTAFAAASKVPTTAPATDWQVAALMSGNTLKLYNFTNNTITDSSVWINGQYVSKVDTIPAMSAVTVDFSHFYNSSGLELNTDKTPVSRVVVESGSGVHQLLGPMIQQ